MSSDMARSSGSCSSGIDFGSTRATEEAREGNGAQMAGASPVVGEACKVEDEEAYGLTAVEQRGARSRPVDVKEVLAIKRRLARRALETMVVLSLMRRIGRKGQPRAASSTLPLFVGPSVRNVDFFPSFDTHRCSFLDASSNELLYGQSLSSES